MELRKRKGETLTEVVISIVLITVIVSIMLNFFSSGYSNNYLLRQRNIDNFAVQEYFEERLSTIKRGGGTGTDQESFEYKIGSRNMPSIQVTGEHLEYKGSSIQLFASNAKESVLSIPEDIDVSLKANKYYYIGETIPAGTVSIPRNTSNDVTFYSESKWLLSNRSSTVSDRNKVVTVGGIVSDTSGSSEINNKTVFPIMPTDFVENAKGNSNLKITDNMRGRYLSFAGRLINSYGRAGNYKEAVDRAWIMGLPIVDDSLDVHTDADLATTQNNTLIPTTGEAYTDIDIKNYRDGKSFVGNVPIQSIYEEELGQARQFITFMGDHTYFSNRRLDGATVAVLIGNKPQSGQLLRYELGDLSWSVNLNEQGRITINVADSSSVNVNHEEQLETADLDYQKDHSLMVRSRKVTGQDELELELFLDGKSVYKQPVTMRGRVDGQLITHPTSGRVYYGGDTYINELAIYSKALNDDELGKLAAYFRGKYSTSYNVN